MSGAILPLLQYASMAWCSGKAQGNFSNGKLSLSLYRFSDPSLFVYSRLCDEMYIAYRITISLSYLFFFF
jgi:hypothetical protein